MKTIFTLALLFGALFTGSAFAAPIAGAGIQADAVIAEASAASRPGTYYDWGRGRDGFGYCYHWTRDGRVLNGGMPVDEYNCEARRPSFYDWARSVSGWGNCYRFTPTGLVMNQGQPQAYMNCEEYTPSYYRWGRAQNGFTYCYQFGKGYILNEAARFQSSIAINGLIESIKECNNIVGRFSCGAARI